MLFQRGQEQLVKGLPDFALASFEAAYEESHATSLLFYIGEAHRLAGRPRDAAAAYRQYLKELPQGPKAGEAAQRLREVRSGSGAKKKPAAPPPQQATKAEPQRKTVVLEPLALVAPPAPAATPAPAEEPARAGATPSMIVPSVARPDAPEEAPALARAGLKAHTVVIPARPGAPPPGAAAPSAPLASAAAATAPAAELARAPAAEIARAPAAPAPVPLAPSVPAAALPPGGRAAFAAERRSRMLRIGGVAAVLGGAGAGFWIDYRNARTASLAQPPGSAPQGGRASTSHASAVVCWSVGGVLLTSIVIDLLLH